jgi:hypothetical protein
MPTAPIDSVPRKSASPSRKIATPPPSAIAFACGNVSKGWAVVSFRALAAATTPSLISRCQ